MKKTEVPQDQAKAFEGGRKALYATDDEGKYAIAQSSGWDVEEVVLQQAIDHFCSLADDALARFHRGETSPLEYHMYNNRMDITLLAQSTGLFKWRVRRHLKPAVFARLKDGDLNRYAEALGMPIEELRTVSSRPESMAR